MVEIEHRIDGVEHTRLFVRAMRGTEEQKCADEAKSLGDELSESYLKRSFMLHSLWTSSGPAFNSFDETGLLRESETDELLAHIIAGLMIVSPNYSRSNSRIWCTKLAEGARHHSNMLDAMLLADCVEGGATHMAMCPHKYYGTNPGDLTDGQHMAFCASREVLEQLRNDDGK